MDTNSELVDEGFGQAVIPDDLDGLYKAVCFWLDKDEDEVKHFRDTARRYVIKHLSVHVAYRKRYAAWEAALNRESVTRQLALKFDS
jgi:hypothetical protein